LTASIIFPPEAVIFVLDAHQTCPDSKSIKLAIGPRQGEPGS
jgi:hypothetical protein